jgi:hypothetical protein
VVPGAPDIDSGGHQRGSSCVAVRFARRRHTGRRRPGVLPVGQQLWAGSHHLGQAVRVGAVECLCDADVVDELAGEGQLAIGPPALQPDLSIH